MGLVVNTSTPSAILTNSYLHSYLDESGTKAGYQ